MDLSSRFFGVLPEWNRRPRNWQSRALTNWTSFTSSLQGSLSGAPFPSFSFFKFLFPALSFFFFCFSINRCRFQVLFFLYVAVFLSNACKNTLCNTHSLSLFFILYLCLTHKHTRTLFLSLSVSLSFSVRPSLWRVLAPGIEPRTS